MPRKDIEFKTTDQVALRGWFYTPDSTPSSAKLPCLVMAHGWSALKEMDLDKFAEYFTTHLPITCLVYDNRGFGASDAAPNAPRHEIIPSTQRDDYSDAITYAQTLAEVDPAKIGVWGSSYSGGHVLYVGAADKRVKAVLSQMPLVNGFENFSRLVRSDLVPGFQAMFAQDRIDRFHGKEAARVAVVSNDGTPSALPTPDSYEFFKMWEAKSNWKNDVTARSVERLADNDAAGLIHRISPTPLLMTVGHNDVLTPTDLALEAYSRAREPKQLHILPGGHFDGYSGPNFEKNAGTQAEFLRKWLCSGLETESTLPIR